MSSTLPPGTPRKYSHKIEPGVPGLAGGKGGTVVSAETDDDENPMSKAADRQIRVNIARDLTDRLQNLPVQPPMQ
jgi:hypothetical protein